MTANLLVLAGFLAVVSLLKNPPARDKYRTLKAHLLNAFGLTESERVVNNLFPYHGFEDAKPSKLKDHMLTLLGKITVL